MITGKLARILANAFVISVFLTPNSAGSAHSAHNFSLDTASAKNRMSYFSIEGYTKIAHLANGGPSLSDSDYFGHAVAAIGDLDRDGVLDLAIGADGDDTGGDARGALYVLFMAHSHYQFLPMVTRSP